MKSFVKNNRLTVGGFTLLELLVSISVISIVAIISAPFLQRSLGRTELRSAMWELEDDLYRVQSNSVNGKNDVIWGIHFDASSYTLFEGPTYNMSDPDNIVKTLSPSLSLTSISLNGGGNDILFTRTTGRTSQFGSIQITDASANEVGTVTITEEGKIED